MTAETLLQVIRTKRTLTPFANAVGERGAVLPSTMRVKRRRAVWTYDSEVLEPVVGWYSIDVIEDEGHDGAPPLLALTAKLAHVLFKTLGQEPALQVAAVIR
jgi:hypothetical protein